MEQLPTTEEYIAGFLRYARPDDYFPFSYWLKVAQDARECMSAIRADGSQPKITGGTGFPPTEYDTARIYPEGVSPNFSPHTHDLHFRSLPSLETQPVPPTSYTAHTPPGQAG